MSMVKTSLTRAQCDSILALHPMVIRSEEVYSLIQYAYQLGHNRDTMKIEIRKDKPNGR